MKRETAEKLAEVILNTKAAYDKAHTAVIDINDTVSALLEETHHTLSDATELLATDPAAATAALNKAEGIQFACEKVLGVIRAYIA